MTQPIITQLSGVMNTVDNRYEFRWYQDISGSITITRSDWSGRPYLQGVYGPGMNTAYIYGLAPGTIVCVEAT